MIHRVPDKPVAAYLAIAVMMAYGVSDIDRVRAQEAGEPALEEVVVVGTRADLGAAIDFKRASDTIVDAISASDIGKMPDQNIADSLQRVPGVQIQRNRGQAEEITIRGLQGRYTQTLVNGRPITTVFSDSLSNRNFQAYIMPSAFVSRLAVHKSGKADIQEGGIAGSVDIVTQRALEIGERRFNVSANGNWDGNNGEIGSDVTAMYADIFADDTLGIVLGVNLVDEDQGLHRDRGGRYRRARNEARDPGPQRRWGFRRSGHRRTRQRALGEFRTAACPAVLARQPGMAAFRQFHTVQRGPLQPAGYDLAAGIGPLHLREQEDEVRRSANGVHQRCRVRFPIPQHRYTAAGGEGTAGSRCGPALRTDPGELSPGFAMDRGSLPVAFGIQSFPDPGPSGHQAERRGNADQHGRQ